MKAAVFYETEDLRLEDVSEPEAGPDEVTGAPAPPGK